MFYQEKREEKIAPLLNYYTMYNVIQVQYLGVKYHYKQTSYPSEVIFICIMENIRMFHHYFSKRQNLLVLEHSVFLR